MRPATSKRVWQWGAAIGVASAACVALAIGASAMVHGHRGTERREPVIMAATQPASVLPAVPPQPVVRKRVVWMTVTAYCPCVKCCGKSADGITASGKLVSYNGGRFVAADTRLFPFGTKLSIPGYWGGRPVPVIDRGLAIKGNHIDVYFPRHQQALKWGRQLLAVTIEE